MENCAKVWLDTFLNYGDVDKKLCSLFKKTEVI